MHARELLQNEIASRQKELKQLQLALRELTGVRSQNNILNLKRVSLTDYYEPKPIVLKQKLSTSSRVLDLHRRGYSVSAIRDQLKPIGCFKNYKETSIIPSIGSIISRSKQSQKRGA